MYLKYRDFIILLHTCGNTKFMKYSRTYYPKTESIFSEFRCCTMSNISYNTGNASSSAGIENIKVAYTFFCHSYF